MGLYWITNRAEKEVKNYHSELEWRRRFVDELKSRGVDVVLDVGANSGQYAGRLREADFDGRIVSFEPLSGPFARLQRSASKLPRWDCRRCALGDFDGAISMNVAGNAGESSSILPMLQRHRDVFPRANYVGTEEVTVSRLDSVASEVLAPNDVVFLKIDVQGFEKQVIDGGIATVNDRCVGIELELSFEPLYDGGMLFQEAFDLMDSLGFMLTGLVPGFIDIRTGQVLQADGVFFRGHD
ncbi:FkbM family methyltransferase [Mycobacterium lentiflavum]|uniref:FkbM family methyltransferase n=1 Tax=Mycobacterium lentiflavum TaxID=141349 RepID=A0A0E4GX79_MYCLN|nr:FkbM family methyltransferase [Mycobacterium lentiflavum]ULP42419.1 FkbM family methyltransferase [Mycobacterium lentiflavum]CQD02496.1 FkbM family methyltransferase [Mycobacterium lentiflavum]